MRRACGLILFLCVLWLFTGCAPFTTTTRPKHPSYAEAKHLREGIKVLADKLVASTRQNKIAVADFIGPGNDVTALGEHVSDKVSVALFSAEVLPDFMERKQLKEVLLS